MLGTGEVPEIVERDWRSALGEPRDSARCRCFGRTASRRPEPRPSPSRRAPAPADLHLRRRHAAAAGDAAALRLREDRRRLRLQVRVLHHPDAARQRIAAGRPTRSCTEARALAARGVKELLLISQDTTFYGIDRGERGALARLLRELNAIDGLEWIRLLYLYPTTIDDDDAGGDGRLREGLQVHRPAAAACVERGAQADEAARHARRATTRCSTASASASPASPSAPPSSSASRARPTTDVDELSAFVDDHAVRPRRRLHLFARGRHLRLRARRRRAGRGQDGAASARDEPAEAAGAGRATARASASGSRMVVDGPSSRPRAGPARPARRPRRRTSTPRSS